MTDIFNIIKDVTDSLNVTNSINNESNKSENIKNTIPVTNDVNPDQVTANIQSSSSISSNTGLTPETVPDKNGNTTKRKKGLGDPDSITYRIPGIIYFFPEPTKDPNYVLLDPENDKKNLEKVKKSLLISIPILFSLYFFYKIYNIGVIIPTLSTLWFFLWRHITLIVFFLVLTLIIFFAKITIPSIIEFIQKFGYLTFNPPEDEGPAKWCYDTFGGNEGLKWTFLIIFGIIYGIICLFFICVLLFIIIPIICACSVFCGLVMGNFNNSSIPFGMAEVEVTEIQKNESSESSNLLNLLKKPNIANLPNLFKKT
jgi:hypothetical protein